MMCGTSDRVAPIKQMYPTEKPVALYERIVRASSSEGDIVLDPFAGCATTLVAAESLRRQWVGIDIWEGAHKLVVERMKAQSWISAGAVTFTDQLPERTDDGETTSPFLRVHERTGRTTLDTGRDVRAPVRPERPAMQGCDRAFDDPRA